MATALIIERANNHSCAFSFQEIQSSNRKSYIRLYQLRLQQLIAQSQANDEKRAKYPKQNLPKTPMTPKRTAKTPNHNIANAMKIQSQSLNQGKRSNSVLSMRQQRQKDAVAYTITSTNISITELRPKSNSKLTPSPMPSNHHRAISAPTKNRKTARKKVGTNTTTRDTYISKESFYHDDLSKSNSSAYTEVSSSTSQVSSCSGHNSAQQSILKTMMLHLNSNSPSDVSKWSLYHDFNEKFSASLSPTVYRNYERIIF